VADRDEFVEGAIAIQPLMRELPGRIHCKKSGFQLKTV
jgi:hypothetical protein